MLTGSAPLLTYAPAANYNGSDSFSFKVSDGTVDSAVASVAITVLPVNDPPVADSRAVAAFDEDTSAEIILTGADVEGSSLTFVVTTPPQHGTLTGAAPNLVYTPALNFHGTDQFAFVAQDGAASSAPAVVALSILPVNDAPSAASFSRSGTENTPVAVTLLASDVEGDPLTYAYTSPSHGTLSGTAPNLTYRSSANFSGVDSFTYRANDGQLDSPTAIVTLAIDNPNDPPVAAAQSIATAEDTPAAIALGGTDPDGDALTVEIVTPPLHGTLTGNGANRLYVPTENYFGPDSFTFRVRDQQFASAPATVTIAVAPVNDAPVATAQALPTAEDTALTITLAGSDIEGSVLSFTVVSAPQHGTLTGSGAARTYVPAPNFNGPDAFAFVVNDGALDSAPVTVAINVTPVNDAPVATAQTVAAIEDTPLTLTLGGTDVENSPLTFAIVTPPQHGTAAIAGATLTYVPAADYNGTDGFTFAAHDGESSSAAAAPVAITIEPRNDAPVAASQTLVVPENATSTLTLGAADVDGDPLAFVFTAPTHGVLSGSPPNLGYTPAPNYVGADSFTFKATDAAGAESNTATVAITIYDVNTPPVATSQAIALDEDTPRSFALAVSDADGDALVYTLVSPPAHGVLASFPASATAAAPTITYTPAANFFGADSFTYEVRDGGATAAQATVTLTVQPVNDAPVAEAQAIATLEDTSRAIVLTGSDPENSSLAFTVITPPAHGTLSGTAPNLAYSPQPNFFGADGFTFKANDGERESAPVTVSITVTPVNDAPVAGIPAITTAEDASIAVTLQATDVENDPLSFSYTQPAHGTLSGTAPNLTYTPAANYFGSDSFTFKARDTGPLDSNTATVAITVTPVNDRPLANAQTVLTQTGVATPITLTGSDIENSPLTFSVVTPPAHGAITGIPPNVTYTSAADFGGFDSFTFKASDGSLDSNPATVLLTAGLPPRSRTYTTTADFALGTQSSISTAVADQLSNKTVLSAYDVVWIANSQKGTVTKLDPETGRVTGEYLVTPDPTISPYPSRIAVDSKGNAWIGNLSHNSIVKIGVPENGGWSDRNGNGLIDSSTSLGDIRAWTGGASGAAATAADEAILLYVRTAVGGVRQIAIDADDNVWVTGSGGPWQKFDGRTGTLLRTEPSIGRGENGGFLGLDGRMYSSGNDFLIWNTANSIASLPQDDGVRQQTWGSALDSKGNLWTTRDWTSTIMKYSPTGELLGEFYHGEPWAMGVAIDANDHVWVAHSHCGHSVGHLLPDGQFLGNVEVANHGPVEVSIDRRGRIWVASSTGVVERINPLGGPFGSDGKTPVGEVDVKSGNLGGSLWTYGRFTGSSFGLFSPDGFWTNTYDGQLAGTTWGAVVWNGEICNDARIEVEAALSADGTNFGPFQALSLANPTPGGSGRYLKTRVRLVSASTGETPVLTDLTVGTAGYTAPATLPSWHVAAGEDIAGNWPDIIQLKGAFCHSTHAFPTDAGSYAWSVVSGPGAVTFSNAATKRPTAQFSLQGTYVLRLTATLNGVTSTDDVAVVLTPYNRAPYPNAGYTIFRADVPAQLWLWGSVRDDGLPVGNAVTSIWSKLFGPGTVTFTNPNSPATTASFSTPGVYVLSLKASDGELAGEDVTTVWLGYSCIPSAPEGIVSWWQASGNGDDHIGGNQAFTELGADYVEGKIGGAFHFDGLNDRVRAFAAPSLDVGAGNGFTLELWARPTFERAAIIAEYGQNNTRGVSVRQNGRGLEVNFRETSGSSHTLSVGDVLPVNTWTHIAASYDRASGEARLFINGMPRVTLTIGSFALATAYDFYLGGAANSTEPFAGLLDEISLYNRAIYADELTAIVNHPAGKRPPVSNVAPIVNAGPDHVGKTANVPVALAGSVSDDGQPTNGALTSLWSKVSGPGVVTFADPTKPNTTATFSEGGVHVLKLFADDGGFCSEDLVEVHVGALYKFDTDSSLAAWWTGNQTDLDSARKLKLERFNGLGYAAGLVADGFYFDGANDYGRVAANAATNLGASSAGLTIEFWAKPSSVGTRDATLFNWGVPGSIEGVRVRQADNAGRHLNVDLVDTAGNGHAVELAGVFASDTWVHLAYTYNRATGIARIYKNGVLGLEQFIGVFTPRTNYPLFVGAHRDGSDRYLGVLDEITFYTRPLTLAEVQAIYDGGVIGKVPLDTNSPPVNNAGADIFALNATAAIQLAGVVTDDGTPVGNAVPVSWSKLEGPGTVTFSNPAAAAPTATFSSAGTYVLRLDSNDGLNQPTGDTVVVRVGVTDSAETDTALAAWWPANGDVREVVRGNHDIEFLPRGPAFATGEVGQGFVFNGDHYGRVPAHSDLDIGASSAGLTIEFWAKPSAVGTRDATLLNWGVPGATEGVRVRQADSAGRHFSVDLVDANGSGHGVELTGVFVSDTWVHVAYTYDRVTGIARIYKNGVLGLEQSIGVFTPRTNHGLFIGAHRDGGDKYLGVLDEISLYRRPLSLADVQAIYNAGASGKAPLDDNTPPLVNAGPDVLALNAATPVQLNGTVSDDGRPLGYPLTIAWSKVDGPGAVTFADSTAPATTATFSEAGTYVLRLDARDAMHTAAPDTMVVRIGITASVDPDGALAAWWPANGDVREAVRGNHDIEFLPRGPAFATGRTGQGFSFNGSDHYGRVPAHSDLDIGASPAGLTIEFWAKPSAVGTRDATLLNWGVPGATEGVRVRQADSAGRHFSVDLVDANGSGHGVELTGVFVSDTWVHVAYTYDRVTGIARIYKNGVLGLEQSIGVFTPRTNHGLFIGAHRDGGDKYLGVLDEISLYRRPLSLADVQAIYNAGASGKAPLDDNTPPIVSAGPDVLVLDPAAAVPLNGSVSDDGRPAGAPLTIVWSKLEGPGIVAFANAAAATTTAAFSAAGTYVLQLDARDGMHAATPDTMVVRVGLTASVEPDSALAAWWPANGEVAEVVRGSHDIEFLPRGPAFATGQTGQGFLFNGTDHYGRVPAHSDLDLGASAAGLTIEFWMKPAQAGSHDATLLHWGITGAVDGVQVRQADSAGRHFSVHLRDSNGGDHHFEATNVFSANTWTHVAYTYDRVTGIARIYRNGVLAREVDIGVFRPRTNLPLFFGAHRDGGDRYEGVLDEICLYTRPLSLADIQAIYAAGASGKAPLDDNQPPVVSAGPDVAVLDPVGAVPLNGSVIDDGRPAGAPLTIEWSKLEGPGTAIFANAAAAATTATFSQPGTYVLQLAARDAMHAARPDTMVVRVGVTASVEPDSALAAWWPANGEVAEVVRGSHDIEFLPRGPAFATGQTGQGFLFNGTDHYGRVPAHSDLDLGASAAGLTIEFWMKPAQAGSHDATLLHWGITGAVDGVQVRQADSAGRHFSVHLRDSNGGDHHVEATNVFSANTWTHVAYTYDRVTGIARIYRNGVLAREVDIGVFRPRTNLPLFFGAHRDGGDRYEGVLDEVCLYTRPLGLADIQAIYNAGASGKRPSATNISPGIVFDSPASGSAFLVGAPVTLGASAVDTDGSIARIEFFDGETKVGEASTSMPGLPARYELLIPGGFAATGRHVLTARAIDNTGLFATSTAVQVEIAAVLPTIAITAPAPNSTVAAGSGVLLQATAAYELGALSRVEFFDGVVKLGESSTPSAGATYSLNLSTGFAPGTHRLTAKAIAADGASALSAAVTLTATATAPSVAVTSPPNNSTLAADNPFAIAATAIDADGTIAKVEFFRGSTKLGEDTTAPYTLDVTAGLPVGTHALTAKATDNTGLTATSAVVSVTFTTYSGPPIAEIVTPAEDARITQPTAITGVVAHTTLASWTLDYRLKAAENAPVESWVTFATGNSLVGTPASGSTPAVPGPLATFDPTSLINGIYELRLRVTGTGGDTLIDGPIPVVVEGNMKTGAFSLAFEDLKLPVAGIPITITRTYDSRDPRVGDFGPGWRLALNNIRVQKNRHLGTDWWQTPQEGSGIQFYDVLPLRDRIVTIVMPDGETHRFKAGAYVKNRLGDPDYRSFAAVVNHGKYRFYPIGDTTSKLEPLDPATNQLAEDFWIGGTGDQDLRADDPNSDPFAPNFNTSRFRLTASDGTTFIIDEALGLLELRDLDGNTLVLNRDGTNRVTGVTSTQNAAGGPIVRTIAIVRDAIGRVDYIRDPAGRDLDYIYDAQGRLASFTNRELNVTQFRYENAALPDYLTRIIDARGVAALRSEYDAAGKLIKQIDADGKETVFNRGVDASGRFEKVKDRLGNETTFYYDERGNVTLKIDPLGAQTTYGYWPDSDRVKFEIDHYGNVKSMAYDAHGNVTVQTLGASLVEDPANPATGYITRTTYNDRSAPTQITDPDGRVQAFSYDPATNNLLTHTIGVGGSAPAATTYTYKPDGTLDTITDALGNTTSHTYNYAFSDPAFPGAVRQTTVTVTDPAGAAGSDPANAAPTVLRSNRSLFDAQENQLAQIVTRTLPGGTTEDVITRYLYDGENRLVATIMPDGRVTETRYTSFGKEETVALWKSLADYQAHNDANARITAYGYDARGNQTSITYADGTTELMSFDLENRKAWSQDRRGYRTFFAYDEVGRLRFTLPPDADDGVGAAAPSSASDPRLANNPRTETRYDLVGRVRFQIDERGSTTEFTYEDGCGCAMRRKEMIQHRALGNLVTRYAYDQAGNVRFVTDPRGNTVETRYDEHGRPTRVVYPATDEHPSTQSETRYDRLGRRIETLDQEGKFTRYRYDALGRLVEVRQYLDGAAAMQDSDSQLSAQDPRLVVTRYAYDEMGNQKSQVDALGRTTFYETDQLGRRTKRTLPKDAAEPVALFETLRYDEWGNLGQRTDFAGKTTTFGYDVLNRLKSKTADPTHASLGYPHAIARIEFDYDASGAREAARTFNAANAPLYSESTPHDERGRIDYKDTAGGRLDYGYYANGRLKDVVSSNSGGVNVGYRYDELNRLEAVDDSSGAASGAVVRTSNYTYNPNGSLETVTQPNGVVHTYGYDALNRLRALIVSRVAASGAPELLHTYEYKLRPSGHRREVVENSTRLTTYAYDDLYRVTGETIAGDPHGNDGAIDYTLDKVGNRLARNSQLSALN